MVLSKLDLALVAVIAAGLFRVEHAHRIVIATPAAAEVMPPAASVCPDTDDVPFSADCIRFIDGGILPDIHARKSATAGVLSSKAHGRADLHAPACPASNENAPYSADCLKFLSGWYWQANPSESAPD
jgi:hypothetical protein